MGLTWIDIGVLLLVVVTVAAAALFAFLVWRSGYVRGWRAARHTPPICPACGYNMTGLSECRCPECGAAYRLDQLWRMPIHWDQHRGQPRQPVPEAASDRVPQTGMTTDEAFTKEDRKIDDNDR